MKIDTQNHDAAVSTFPGVPADQVMRDVPLARSGPQHGDRPAPMRSSLAIERWLLRLHYARTLEHWLERIERTAGRVATMFDERFVRMWRMDEFMRLKGTS